MTPLDPAVDLRPLGGTGIPVSPITPGTSPLGGPADADAEQLALAEVTADALLAGPYAMIDTAHIYAGGRSEATLGAALARRAEAGLASRTIATKADRDPASGRFDREQVLRAFEESSERLGLESFDVYHLHDPAVISVEDALAPGGAVQGLLELKEQGRVRALGIATGTLALMHRYVDSGHFEVLLTHNRFSLVDRSALPLLEKAAERGIGVFNAAPFGGGLLARGTAGSTKYAYREAPPELLAWVDRAEALCREAGTTLATAALQFSLRSPLVHSTVVGTGRPERLEELERLRAAVLPAGFWDELERLGTPPSTNID